MIFNWASSLVGIRGRGWTGRAQKAWRNDVERINAKRGIGLNKLRTYKLFKTEYKVEEYEFKGRAVNQRSAMARFICRVAPLNLEIGCVLIIPVNERLCNFCPDQVEDESHVILICPLYRKIREELFIHASYINVAFMQMSGTEDWYFYSQIVKLHLNVPKPAILF